MLTVGDLFSGIGGFSLGLERAGMRTAWFAEVDPYASAVLRKHWPDVPNHGDVRSIHRGVVEPPDVLSGGFPCQDISNAGKRAGIDGERSGLWGEYARIIGELRPRYVIVENVAALLGRGIERVLGDLAALGFDAEWHCIPASAVGAPHRRDRVWIVAYSQSERQQACRPERSGNDAAIRGGDECPRHLQTPSLSGCGAHVADANEPRLQRRLRESLRECADERALGTRNSCRGISTPWSAEPDVGRVANGVPSELDRDGYAEEKHDAEGCAQGNGGSHGVPSMQRDREARAPSSRLLAADIGRGLVSSVSHQSGPAGRHASHESDEAMRALRERLPADAQQEARAMQPGMSLNRWPHERGEAVGQVWSVEPDVGRVAHGVANRVDRLRCLGNAIVPAIAEIIGRAIVRAHE